jgi:hypothetical protein
MSCGRSAILMLLSYALVCPPLRSSEFAGASADPVHARIACHTGSSIGCHASYRTSGRATLSQFVRWKGRVKCVLGETIEEIVDECDLGPAVLPDRPIAQASIELTTRPFSTCAPLRC